jgi:Asp-tRNA(Asn)/Glu-tRNA(Gln) amidotransferase A subunit family amidase
MLMRVGSVAADTKSAGVDVLLMPTTPTPARLLSSLASADALDAYADDVMTVGVSLAGVPAVSVPGESALRARAVTNTCVPVRDVEGARMPVGMQFVGRAGDELDLLHAASFLDIR